MVTVCIMDSIVWIGLVWLVTYKYYVDNKCGSLSEAHDLSVIDSANMTR